MKGYIYSVLLETGDYEFHSVTPVFITVRLSLADYIYEKLLDTIEMHYALGETNIFNLNNLNISTPLFLNEFGDGVFNVCLSQEEMESFNIDAGHHRIYSQEVIIKNPKIYVMIDEKITDDWPMNFDFETNDPLDLTLSYNMMPDLQSIDSHEWIYYGERHDMGFTKLFNFEHQGDHDETPASLKLGRYLWDNQ